MKLFAIRYHAGEDRHVRGLLVIAAPSEDRAREIASRQDEGYTFLCDRVTHIGTPLPGATEGVVAFYGEG